jgi:hypothetical protein
VNRLAAVDLEVQQDLLRRLSRRLVFLRPEKVASSVFAGLQRNVCASAPFKGAESSSENALTGMSMSDISRITIGSGLTLALPRELSEAFTLLPGVGVCFCTSFDLSATSRGLFRPFAMGIIVRSPCAEVMFRVAGGRAPGAVRGFLDLNRNDILAATWEAGEGDGLAQRCGQ